MANHHVVVELAARRPLQRAGVLRNQLAEELVLRRLRPVDELHSLGQLGHQRRQAGDEALADRRSSASAGCLRTRSAPARRNLPG
jgi:hypothetical protein